MTLPPVSSPKSDAFEQSFGSVEIQKPQANFGSSTITSASPAPETAPEEQQVTCCLTRCLSYIGEQISHFFEWFCSLFTSSKPATKEMLEKAKEEIKKQLDPSMQLIGNRYTNLQADTSDKLDSGKRLDNIFLYFADEIEFMRVMGQISTITTDWHSYESRLEKQLIMDDDQIITKRRFRAEKIKLNELFKAFNVLAQTPFPLHKIETSKETVKNYCIGRMTIEKEGRSYSLIDLIDLGEEIGCSCNLEVLKKDFQGIIDEYRARFTAPFKPRIENIMSSIKERYAGILPDKIKDDNTAIAVLADAIEIFTHYKGLLKGDISSASAAEVIEKRIQELETLLKPSNPLFKPVTPEMCQAVTHFNFNTEYELGVNWSRTLLRSRTLLSCIRHHHIKYATGEVIESRLQDVINKLQNPPKH